MSGAWSFPPTCDLSAVLHEMHAKPSPFSSSRGCEPSGASVMSTEFSGPEKLFSQSLSPDCAESRSGLSKPRRHPKPHGRCPHRLPQAPALRLCSSAPFLQILATSAALTPRPAQLNRTAATGWGPPLTPVCFSLKKSLPPQCVPSLRGPHSALLSSARKELLPSSCSFLF